MFKRVKFSWDSEHELFYPADKHTAFYIGGRNAFYTIIDVVSSDNDLFAMLENNELGEEDIIIVKLGSGVNPNIYLLEKYNRRPIPSGLTGGSRQAILLFKEQIITEEVYDDLKTVLIEDGIISPEYQHIEEWSEKDINKESLIGGIIK